MQEVTMPKKLPERPNLDHLKSQAKDLLRAFKAGDVEALARIRDFLPAARGVDDERLSAMDFALHDAQSVIAREYGFSSFTELRHHVESARPTAETLRALLEPLNAPLPEEVVSLLLAAASEAQPERVSVESPVPLLPLRNALLAVGATAPLSIGRQRSIAAVEAARDGAGVLAVFSQKDETREAPLASELHPVGCLAKLIGVVPAGNGGLWIVVRALVWIELGSIQQVEPFGLARVRRFAVNEQERTDVKGLEQTLRSRLRAFAARLPAPDYVLRLTERMSALELADAAIANLRCTVEEKARYASEPDLRVRLEYVLQLLDRAA
jgi:Lon protease-like protein